MHLVQLPKYASLPRQSILLTPPPPILPNGKKSYGSAQLKLTSSQSCLSFDLKPDFTQVTDKITKWNE